MLTYIGYAIGAAMLCAGCGAFAALGWQVALQAPKLRGYRIKVVRK